MTKSPDSAEIEILPNGDYLVDISRVSLSFRLDHLTILKMDKIYNFGSFFRKSASGDVPILSYVEILFKAQIDIESFEEFSKLCFDHGIFAIREICVDFCFVSLNGGRRVADAGTTEKK